MAIIENYFVGIGAQKSGTTWLARMLATHPDVFVTPVKEIHYFDHITGVTEHLSQHKRRSRYRKYHQRMWTQWSRFSEHTSQWQWWRDYMRTPIDDDWYCRLFTHRGNRRMAGEITPEYAMIGKDGLAHIHRLAPTARVLFIMRNPVDRMWSQVLHQCRVRGLDANALAADAIFSMLKEPRFRELGDYSQTLDDMNLVFGKAQSLPLFYEEMHQDRLAALQQVCTFLRVSFEPEYFSDLGKRYNRSQQARLRPEIREHLRQQCQPQAEAVAERMGRLPESWSQEFGI
ncbi:MAG: sulfotransferase family protein [Hyphomicrobiaceae bacterium]